MAITINHCPTPATDTDAGRFLPGSCTEPDAGTQHGYIRRPEPWCVARQCSVFSATCSSPASGAVSRVSGPLRRRRGARGGVRTQSAGISAPDPWRERLAGVLGGPQQRRPRWERGPPLRAVFSRRAGFAGSRRAPRQCQPTTMPALDLNAGTRGPMLRAEPLHDARRSLRACPTSNVSSAGS